MKNKFFTTLLAAVLLLAQFSIASAAQVAGTASITSIPDFGNATDVSIDWAVTGMSGSGQNILIWSRVQSTPAVAYGNCELVGNFNSPGDASGTYVYSLAGANNNEIWEFIVTVDDDICGGGTVYSPTAGDTPMGSTYIDNVPPYWLIANPPTLEQVPFTNLSTACNTFELWGIASETYKQNPADSYSGFEGWHTTTTGSFTPPAPEGPADSLLSWVITFPSTANGPWTFEAHPEDKAGNTGLARFRFNQTIDDGSKWADELADCVTYPDIEGTDTEVYVRYMSQLDLAHGYQNDSNFKPDNTLTRAEMAAFIEMANGYTGAGLPTAAPTAACSFTDVNDTDWFAGWAWQACKDGFMVGLGGGLFGPNDTLTRGQVVTVLDNLKKFGIPPRGGYFAVPENIFDTAWGKYQYRTVAWTDVNIGDYFANGVINSYGVGVADSTGETTFSPNQPILRGEFMKMMYRALSRVRLP